MRIGEELRKLSARHSISSVRMLQVRQLYVFFGASLSKNINYFIPITQRHENVIRINLAPLYQYILMYCQLYRLSTHYILLCLHNTRPIW
jgi:hypothetical protein